FSSSMLMSPFRLRHLLNDRRAEFRRLEEPLPLLMLQLAGVLHGFQEAMNIAVAGLRLAELHALGLPLVLDGFDVEILILVDPIDVAFEPFFCAFMVGAFFGGVLGLLLARGAGRCGFERICYGLNCYAH